MTRWSCGRLAGVGRPGHRTMLRLPACAVTSQAGCTRGQAATHVGDWSVWTRADAVNKCPPHGGCHCHVARCPFPLVARLLLTVCPNFSRYEAIRKGTVTGSSGRLVSCEPRSCPGSDFQRLTNVPMVEVSTNSRSRRSVMALPAVSMEWPVRSLISR